MPDYLTDAWLGHVINRVTGAYSAQVPRRDDFDAMTRDMKEAHRGAR